MQRLIAKTDFKEKIENWLKYHIDEIAEEEDIAKLTVDLGEGSLYETIFNKVGLNDYWIDSYVTNDKEVPSEEIDEYVAFIDKWLTSNGYEVS